MMNLQNPMLCKICNSPKIKIFRHTAKCKNCGVLLYYPYPKDDEEIINSGDVKSFGDSFSWYAKSSFLNHKNFTKMLQYTIDKSYTEKTFNVLDFGGGGGQFALVCKSHFPRSKVYITDIDDSSLLDEWKKYNIQISHKDFLNDTTKFDFIFMNDVFEHLSNPDTILCILQNKLKSNGKIFIDTPRQFLIYPITKILSKDLYSKVLKGTVSTAHLQIWSKKSFLKCITNSNLFLSKYKEIGEFTMDPDFYMKNMGIKSFFIKGLGRIFYQLTLKVLKNKILAVLKKK